MHLDLWTIALQTINFLILAALLYRFLYKPVLRMIDARKAEVQKHYDDAKATEAKARSQLAGLEAERESLASEREKLLRAAEAQAQQILEARRSQAQSEAKAELAAARKTLALEREEALEEARRAAIDLGAQFARRLLADVPMPLRAEAWIERIEQHVTALAKQEREALARQLTNGAALTVFTASPLPEAASNEWRGRLRSLLGKDIVIDFKTNPELVAGAELHFPAAMLRMSWQSALETFRAEIASHAYAS